MIPEDPIPGTDHGKRLEMLDVIFRTVFDT